MSKESLTEAAADFLEDPVARSSNYVAKMKGFNSIFLMDQRLDRNQLKVIAPVIKEILQDYKNRKPFEELPEGVRKTYETEEEFIETRQHTEETNLSLVSNFLFNVTKVIGPQSMIKELRKGSKEATQEEAYYAYAILRLEKYRENPKRDIEGKDIDLINSAVETAYQLLERI
jgi:hypothetical protein